MNDEYVDRCSASYHALMQILGAEQGKDDLHDFALKLSRRTAGYHCKEVVEFALDLPKFSLFEATHVDIPAVAILPAVAIRFWHSWSKGGYVAIALSKALGNRGSSVVAAYLLAHVLAEIYRGHDIERGYCSAESYLDSCEIGTSVSFRALLEQRDLTFVPAFGRIASDQSDLTARGRSADPLDSVFFASWAAQRSHSFEEAMRTLPGSTNFLAKAITAQIAGAMYGMAGLSGDTAKPVLRRADEVVFRTLMGNF